MQSGGDCDCRVAFQNRYKHFCFETWFGDMLYELVSLKHAEAPRGFVVLQ